MSPRLLLVWLLFVLGFPAIAADIIGAPKVSPSGSSSVISWKTDVETGTRVSYGLAPNQLTEHAESGITAAHEITLTGLKPGAKYFFAVGTARKKLAVGEFIASGSPATVNSPPSSSPAALPPAQPPPKSGLAKIFGPKLVAPPTRETWGNFGTLPDHFARHGADFRAKDADDYARMAWEFGQRAKQGDFDTKVDEEGTRRVFDPKTGAFAAYNRDGTTKTYFKPNSRDYFARQPGRMMMIRRL